RPELSSMPVDILAKIRAPFEPQDDASFRVVNKKLRDVSDSFLAALVRFDSKDWVTLGDLITLRSFDQNLVYQKEFKLDLRKSDIPDSELQSIIEHFPNIT